VGIDAIRLEENINADAPRKKSFFMILVTLDLKDLSKWITLNS